MWQNDIFFATSAVDALIVVANWEKSFEYANLDVGGFGHMRS